jgi:glycosyltransferase involved in cell wall biosynthesis
MAPARPGRNDNPYLTILTDALALAGTEVVELTPFTRSNKVDALHVHWLEFPVWGPIASRSPLWSSLRMKRTIALARVLRSKGRRVIWTAHNLNPHDFQSQRHADIYETLCREFLPLVTDVICMSESARSAIVPAFPQLADARFHVIRHPSYVNYFKTMAPELPAELRSNALPSGPVIGTFGILRPYKAIPATIRAMKALTAPFCFVIAGKGPDSEMTEIHAAIDDDPRFIFIGRRLNDAEILGLTRACDLVLFNFKTILNSGSVLASLSMGRPVLAPELGSVRDLQMDLGANWVRTFKGALNAETIANALSGLPLADVPDLQVYAPEVVAREHVAAYSNGARASTVPR